MKKLLLLCLLPAFCLQAGAQDKKALRYVDAAELTIMNRSQDDAPGFRRLDVDKYPELTKTVRRYFSYSTGIAIAFRTDSRNIHARWTTVHESKSINNTVINQSGLDLYIRQGDEWVFAGVGTPGWKPVHESAVVSDMAEGVKECMLYLPLFNEVSALSIGVDEGASIEALPNPFDRKIVVVGSSITHGASAGRPGLAYPAILERNFGMEFTNLGASGQCRLDSFYAEIVCDSEADAFIFDAFSNPNAKQINERLMPLVARIREVHPDTPLIFLQTEVRETGTFDLKKRDYERKKREAAEAGMKEVMKKYDNVYFINPGMVLPENHEGTTDGVHPNDAGFASIVKKLQPKLKKIFRKHGIR